MEFLFNEELGLVVEVDEKALHDLWEATSFELDKLQSNPACAEQEQEGLKKRHKPAWKLTYEPRATPAECRGFQKVHYWESAIARFMNEKESVNQIVLLQNTNNSWKGE